MTILSALIALVFVPPTFVRVAWRALKGEAPAFRNREQFLEYFQDNWIEGNYPLRMNMYSLDGPRTNNNAEGWRSKICKLKYPKKNKHSLEQMVTKSVV